jgi:hypothetical protein
MKYTKKYMGHSMFAHSKHSNPSRSPPVEVEVAMYIPPIVAFAIARMESN